MDQPVLRPQLHVHLAEFTRLLVRHRQQLPRFLCAAGQHRHGDAHGGAIGAVDPGVVGHGQLQVRAGVQRCLHHTAVEGLAQAVGGDEAHALRLPARHLRGGVLPPEHDEIGAVGHFGPGAAQGFDVAVAQGRAHGASADEGRVADDEIRLRPRRPARACIALLGHLRGLVGHQLAGDRVRLEARAVPARAQPAGGVVGGLARVPGQHCVAAFDVAVGVHHRLGHAGAPARADVPLQPADPQHQLGQRGGALVQLDAQQLLQGHGLAGKAELVLRLAQLLQGVDDLALQALEVLQRDVQEIGATAGRIEHAHAAQVVVEVPDLRARLGEFDLGRAAVQRGGLARQHQGGGAHVLPAAAQRLDHGGQHQALDVGARRVVRAQGVALGGVERALQQRAEDGRLDLAPVGARGLDQQPDLRGGEQQAVAVLARALEELAVEVQHAAGQHGAEAALVHVAPQHAQHLAQRGRVVAVGLQQLLERAPGQQLDVLGEHGKQAAGQEVCYLFRSYLRLLYAG